jgi:hypothetical protein
MASFADAPAGDLAVGEKIFKTKCAREFPATRRLGARGSGGGGERRASFTCLAERDARAPLSPSLPRPSS